MCVCNVENARIAQDQGEYQKRYNSLVERYEKAKARFDELTVDGDHRREVSQGREAGGVHQDA